MFIMKLERKIEVWKLKFISENYYAKRKPITISEIQSVVEKGTILKSLNLRKCVLSVDFWRFHSPHLFTFTIRRLKTLNCKKKKKKKKRQLLRDFLNLVRMVHSYNHELFIS